VNEPFAQAPQLEAPETRRVIADARGHVGRHRIARERRERLQDALQSHPGRARVPDRERRDAVGVEVLRRLDQLGEREQSLARLPEARIRDLEQHGEVTLDDEREVGRRHGCGIAGGAAG
jgi:hypothetical protein